MNLWETETILLTLLQRVIFFYTLFQQACRFVLLETCIPLSHSEGHSKLNIHLLLLLMRTQPSKDPCVDWFMVDCSQKFNCKTSNLCNNDNKKLPVVEMSKEWSLSLINSSAIKYKTYSLKKSISYRNCHKSHSPLSCFKAIFNKLFIATWYRANNPVCIRAMSAIYLWQYFPFLTKLDGISIRCISEQLCNVFECLCCAFFILQIFDLPPRMPWYSVE